MKNTTKQFNHILAIDSATSLCSVALRSGKKLSQLSTNAIGTHSSAIFAHAKELLSTRGLSISDLDGMLIGTGPGSYTGLRVVASAVKGMLFGQDVPLFGVNTLAGFAAGLNENIHEKDVHVIIDARRKHVYTQSFRMELSEINDVKSLSKGSLLQQKSNANLNSVTIENLGNDVNPNDLILKTMKSINNPSLIEIDDLYDRFKVDHFLIGTGIQRLNPSSLHSLQIREIDKTGAIGLIRIFEAGLDHFFNRMDVTDFEPTYSVNEN